MAEQVDTSFKVVVNITTRPQHNQQQMENWTAGIKPWAASKVADMIAAYTGTGLVVEELGDRAYGISITDRGLDPDFGGDRLWTIYPKQSVAVTVDDEAAWCAHIDSYYTALQTEIRAAADSAPVNAKMNIIDWHMHGPGGNVDEVEP